MKKGKKGGGGGGGGGGLGWENKEKRKHVEIGKEGVKIMVEEGAKGMSKEIEKQKEKKGRGGRREGGRRVEEDKRKEWSQEKQS